MGNVSQVGSSPDDVFQSRAESAAVLAEEAQRAAEDAQAAAEDALAATLAALSSQTLNEHADVSVPAPTADQVLTFIGPNWEARDLPAGAGVADLSDLTDVDTTGVADTNLLTYVAGSARWEPIARTALAFLPLAGGTVTGPIVLPGDPTLALQAATKSYVDTRFVTVNPYDLAAFIDGNPAASADFLRFVSAREWFIPAGGGNSACFAAVAATATYAIDIQRNGVSVGTITFAAASQTGTFTIPSAIVLSPGDRLDVICSATPDASIEDLALTFQGVIGTP